jgi:hypothetical protein
VTLEQITDGQHVLDDIIQYFDTGRLDGNRVPEEARLRFIRPRLIAVEDILLAARSRAMQQEHPVLPWVREMFVAFTVEDEEIEVPEWSIVENAYAMDSHGDASFTFTSALPATTNLLEFATTVLSAWPQDEKETTRTSHEVFGWLTEDIPD